MEVRALLFIELLDSHRPLAVTTVISHLLSLMVGAALSPQAFLLTSLD